MPDILTSDAAVLTICASPTTAPQGSTHGDVGEQGTYLGLRRRGGLTIDMHCHALCVAVEQLVGPHPRKIADQQAMDRAQGQASVAYNAGMLRSVGPKLTNVEQRLKDMDATGIDIQALSPAPNQYYYWADDDLSEELTGLQNTHIAALCSAHPDRFVGLGTVSLQNPTLAIAQLEHAVNKLGLRGVEISTAVNGVSVADPRFHPFWARAEALGCAVLLHPLGSEQGERLNQHYLWNVIGQPFETTVALSQLILDGLFERHPGTRLCTCHGGGYLAAYWGRLDHAWKVRPEARTTPHPPSHYLRKVFFDTVVHDPEQLRQLIDTVGASQVVAGTDYPFDMGEADLLGFLDRVHGLTDAELRAIRADNAARLLGLEIWGAAPTQTGASNA